VGGTYAAAFEGTLMVTLGDGTKKPVPNAFLGIGVVDGEGNMSQHGYLVVGNQAIRFGIEPEDPPFTGKITVNPDCTGIVELSRGEVFEVIVDPRGEEVNYIETVSPSGAPTFTGRAKRISWAPPDQLRSNGNRPYLLGGTYVTRMKGVNLNPEVGPLPSAALGFGTIGYDGTYGFSGTKVVAGTSIPIVFENGGWEDGELPYTGTVTGSVIAGGTQYLGEYEGFFVVLGRGDEIWCLSLEEPAGSPVVTGVMKRVSFRTAD